MQLENILRALDDRVETVHLIRTDGQHATCIMQILRSGFSTVWVPNTKRKCVNITIVTWDAIFTRLNNGYTLPISMAIFYLARLSQTHRSRFSGRGKSYA